ncbi:MAG TPA: hypothetical protein VEF89_17345 [Solirubrobacteraceae bacterium]|nr:hypothetical protein [Solirubrobacteraceae bacterium]
MADLNFRKLLGRWRWVALPVALLASALIVPTAAYASGGAGITGVAVMPAAAQGAVDAALARASQAGSNAAAVVASVSPAPVPAPSVAVSPQATPGAAPPASQPPAQPSPPAVPPASAAVAAASSQLASSPPGPQDAAGAVAEVGQLSPARSTAAAVPRGLVPSAWPGRTRGITRPGRHRSASGHWPAVAPHTAPYRVILAPERQPVTQSFLLSSPPRSAGQRSQPSPAGPHRPAPRPGAARLRRTSGPIAGASAATAALPLSPPTSASLPPGGAGVPAGGGGGGASPGGIAATLLALAALALLLAFLPGLLALELLPWRSAVLASPLERPG